MGRSVWGKARWLFVRKETRGGLYLTPYTEVDSQWIVDLTVKVTQ